MEPHRDPRGWHRARGWPDQLERAKRWHMRAIDALDVAASGAMTPTGRDDIYAFFINAFHVGDWMRTDGAIAEVEWNAYVSDNFELGLCRDLCNGFKHRRLTKLPSVDPSPWLRRESVPPGERWHVIAGDDKRVYQLRDIIDRTMQCVDILAARISDSTSKPGLPNAE